MTYKLNRIFSIIIALLIFCGNKNITNAAPFEITPLKVGYIINTGFFEEDWTGHYRGSGYEYMESLSNYGRWSFEYVPYKNWLELGESLQSGVVDVIPCMPGDYHIFKNTARTEHVVGRFPMELVISNAGVKPEMNLGTATTNYPTPALPLIAEDEGFSYNLTSYTDYYDMLESFKNGEIDGYIGAMVYPRTNHNILAIFDRQSYRLLVRSSDKELLEQLNQSMDQMLLEQPNIRDRLRNKYLHNNGYPLILTRQERDYLQKRQKLIIFQVFLKLY